MATLLQLRDQIIKSAGIQGFAEFPTVYLNRLINLAQRYVQTELNGLGMKKWEKEQAVTAGLTAAAFGSSTNNVKTVIIGSTYFPNMIESPKSIKFIMVNDVSNYGIAYEVGEERFFAIISNTYSTPSVKEAVFMRLAGKVYLAPTGITAAIAFYYQVITDLASDGDITEIPLEFEEYIIKKVVAEINFELGKIQDKQLAENQIRSEIQVAYEKFLGKQAEINRPKINERAKLQ